MSTKKQLMKEHRITEKQIELIRLVAKHPIFGATERSMGRILPGALRSGLVEKVWLDRGRDVSRTVTDYQIGCPKLKNTSNTWYELSQNAVAFMQALEPGWTYDRPSARWPA